MRNIWDAWLKDLVVNIIAWTIIIAIIIALIWGFDKLWRAGSGGRGFLDPRPISEVCANSENIQQACIDYRIDQCLATERYTMDQCVSLIGGGK